jgi:hypothetical protein
LVVIVQLFSKLLIKVISCGSTLLDRIHSTVTNAVPGLQATSLSSQMLGSQISTSSRRLGVKKTLVVISTSSCQRYLKGKIVFINIESYQYDFCIYQLGARYRSKVRIAVVFCHCIVGLQKGPLDILSFAITQGHEIEGFSVIVGNRLSIGDCSRLTKYFADF